MLGEAWLREGLTSMRFSPKASPGVRAMGAREVVHFITLEGFELAPWVYRPKPEQTSTLKKRPSQDQVPLRCTW